MKQQFPWLATLAYWLGLGLFGCTKRRTEIAEGRPQKCMYMTGIQEIKRRKAEYFPQDW